MHVVLIHVMSNAGNLPFSALDRNVFLLLELLGSFHHHSISDLILIEGESERVCYASLGMLSELGLHTILGTSVVYLGIIFNFIIGYHEFVTLFTTYYVGKYLFWSTNVCIVTLLPNRYL